ncbi:MAG: hypothetical protein DRM97_06900 [Thermoprotei archaeon]|nr:MAG: hypothetical protein DRM97_06900 [Thermoprotei archaeon]
MRSTRAKELIRTALLEGYQLSPDAIKLLLRMEDPIKALRRIIAFLRGNGDQRVVIDKDCLLLLKEGPDEWADARGYDARLRIIEEVKTIDGEASYESFRRYFLDRLRRLSRIIRQRPDFSGCMKIGDLGRGVEDEVKVIGLVYDKREVKNGFIISIEDETGFVDVFVPKDSLACDKVRFVVPDICIGVEGIVRNGMIIAEDLAFPECKPNPPPRAPPLSVLLVSDLHVGSSMFRREAFERLVDWLRKGEDPVARSVKYVLIAGDIVDGAGIYPGQEEELMVRDVREQYREAAKLIEKIPDHIEVIIVPGNHDATSLALPYIGIFEEYAEELLQLPNVMLLSDPTTIAIHDVIFTISHGRSLDDLIAYIPGASFDENGLAVVMKCLVKFRHLAPIYGSRTPLAPLSRDYMVLDVVPHVIHLGHIHICSVTTYKGVLLINTGTWQEQTQYQRTLGIMPTPCRAVVVRLSDLKVKVLNFNAY